MNYRLKKDDSIIEVLNFDKTTRIIIQNNDGQTYIDLNKKQFTFLRFQCKPLLPLTLRP